MGDLRNQDGKASPNAEVFMLLENIKVSVDFLRIQ